MFICLCHESIRKIIGGRRQVGNQREGIGTKMTGRDRMSMVNSYDILERSYLSKTQHCMKTVCQ